MNTNAMEIWVAGSTGLVGASLVEQLLEQPEVTRIGALVRRPHWAPRPKVEELVVDFEALETSPALAGRPVSHAACCLGTTIAKAGSQEAFRRVDFDYVVAFGRAARKAGARTFLVVSALGANQNSSIFYNRVKGEVEAVLSELGFPTLHILRPSLLLGERNEQRLGEQVASVIGRPLGHLLFGPLKKYAPIQGADVARALIQLALDPREGRFVHESHDLAQLARLAKKSA
jgi:uncharacterized protein YbjT (DUF2867 family)